MRMGIVRGIVTAVAFVGLGLQPAWADGSYGHGKESGGKPGGYGGHGYGMGGHYASTGHLLRGLLQSQKEMGLTDEQVAKLKGIQLDLDRTRIKTEADIMVAERELQALIEDDKTELSAIEDKMKQAEMQEVSLRLTAIKARRAVMALLTPEQSQRIKTVHEAMMQKYKDGPKEGHRSSGMMKGHGAAQSEKKDADKAEPKH